MNMRKLIKTAIVAASVLTLGATEAGPAMDPDNPTCPLAPNWSTNATMELTPKTIDGTKVLLAEGAVDACNFVFMGGRARIVEPGAHFMVHMFTMTNDRNAINYSIEMGTDSTVGLIGEVEQQSALLATEDNDFLIRMGVSRKLLSEVMYRTNAVKTEDGDRSTRRCLTGEEALRYNVANVGG